MIQFNKYLILLCFGIINLGAFAQNVPEFVLPKLASDAVIIQYQNDSIEVSNEELKHYLQVFTTTKNEVYKEQFAIQGSYKATNNSIIFLPDFPFMEGQRYFVRAINPIQNSKNNTYINASFFIPKKIKPKLANVLKIYPSSRSIPENTLRFYIYFSTPMKREVALQHIHLIAKNGKEDKHAFMKFKRELWSPDGKRLTLLFDPGRIKRGVSTHLEKGAALLVHNNYKLVISNTWKDVYNQPLNTTFTKNITVSKGYRSSIKTKDWKINKPKINSKEQLVITFDRIFDSALLQSMIIVKDKNNNIINGNITITENEKKWSFVPKLKWTNPSVFIWINPRLEDVAGNNFHDLLDHTVKQGSTKISTIKLPIKLRPENSVKKVFK